MLSGGYIIVGLRVLPMSLFGQLMWSISEAHTFTANL